MNLMDVEHAMSKKQDLLLRPKEAQWVHKKADGMPLAMAHRDITAEIIMEVHTVVLPTVPGLLQHPSVIEMSDAKNEEMIDEMIVMDQQASDVLHGRMTVAHILILVFLLDHYRQIINTTIVVDMQQTLTEAIRTPIVVGTGTSQFVAVTEMTRTVAEIEIETIAMVEVVPVVAVTVVPTPRIIVPETNIAAMTALLATIGVVTIDEEHDGMIETVLHHEIANTIDHRLLD